ncbi:S-adenosylmethionine:tRNA ribosyltransferase-isomerase [Candidatus Peribacteria bacterium]|nr:S-adenosylmethionine:tRNA ribosyltransferase-isomerase [Candidatus Peribacteria bacterium]
MHFTQAILDDLAKKVSRHELTLHVWGLGTFKPIPRSEEAHNIRLHHETIQISIDLLETLYHLGQSSKHIVAVGTTVVPYLESLDTLYDSSFISEISVIT